MEENKDIEPNPKIPLARANRMTKGKTVYFAFLL